MEGKVQTIIEEFSSSCWDGDTACISGDEVKKAVKSLKKKASGQDEIFNERLIYGGPVTSWPFFLQTCTGMDLNIFRPRANRAPNFSNLGARIKC